jgi:glutamyl-tRNA(Gln) amidotransferase subunit D
MYKGAAKEALKGIELGDRVSVKKGERTFEGVLMPRSELGDENHIVIKLDTGYNIGINVKSIKVTRIEKAAPAKKTKEKEVKSKDLPDVTIIGTGGTIASKIDYKTGAVHPSFTTSELTNAIPELSDIANIKTKLLFNILSENMTPDHWRDIAKAVVEELNSGADGVVVAHGTDTLGYTSAALSFMLKNLEKPVVLVGSQRSSDRPSSDSSLNLVSAVKVATSDIGEVVAVMHASSSDDHCLIHRGTKVRKLHSSRRDAFKSVNAKPIGKVEDIVIVEEEDYKRRGSGKVEVDDALNENVALVKIYPGIESEVLDYYIDNYKGIVLEGTGLGHVPENLLKSIEKAKKKKVPVVMTTQTTYGRVDMKVYSTGRELLSRGVISGEDMLPETAYVKLMHVLGGTKDPDEIKKKMQTNIAGEIEERTEF